MNKFEKLLFEVAPWTRETMEISKNLNNGSFLRGRTGWIRRNIRNPESIYEHSCKVGIAAWYLLGTDEAVAQGIIHDFPEILEQDYIPSEIDARIKREKEYAAMKEIKNNLPDGHYWLKAWENYDRERGIGIQINELDKMCPCIQAKEYLQIYKNNKLEEFYPYARKKITTQPLLNLLDKMQLVNINKENNMYDLYFKELKQIEV